MLFNMENKRTILEIENLSKTYQLGQIGRGTLTEDLVSWWAKIRKKEDPNAVIGEKTLTSKGDFVALQNLDLTCYQGEKIGVIGHNGAGKSTLLKLICGITVPTTGSIKYNGKISSMLEVGTGFVADMTGRENIFLNGTILGMNIKEIESKIEDIIEFSECRQFIDTPVKRYSSGMFVKLAFAVAAHLSNNIVIMDEVLAVGDAQFQQKCIKKMTEIAQEDNKCVLFVSHNMQLIKQFCSRCIVLEKGTKIYDGNVDEAIDLYLQKNNSVSLEYDLTKSPRSKRYDEVKINGFKIIDKSDIVFQKNEILKFNINYIFCEKLRSPYISVLLKHIDETLLGSVRSEVLECVELNTELNKMYEFDLSSLPPGKYFMQVRMMQDNEHSEPIVLDEPVQNISINIQDTISYANTWPRTLMGYTNFGKLISK